MNKILARIISILRTGKTNHANNEIVELLKGFFPNGIDCFLDVGAHHGEFTILLNNFFQVKRGYCFEPTPESFKILSSRLNGKNCNLTNKAVSNYSGIADFFINRLDETNSLLKSNLTNSKIDSLISEIDRISIEVTFLDQFCSDNDIDTIDFLKIDAQGSSIDVLKGAHELLKEHSIKLVQCEVEFLEIYKGEALYHEIAKYMESLGYSLYTLHNIHFDVNGRISWADAIFYVENDWAKIN